MNMQLIGISLKYMDSYIKHIQNLLTQVQIQWGNNLNRCGFFVAGTLACFGKKQPGIQNHVSVCAFRVLADQFEPGIG